MIPVGRFVTRRYPMEGFLEAYDTSRAGETGALKVVLTRS
jgi:threonine dehydrogenase-like Zn-dependent dehydrogenase